MGLRSSCDPSTPLYYIGRDRWWNRFSLRFFDGADLKKKKKGAKYKLGTGWRLAAGWGLIGCICGRGWAVDRPVKNTTRQTARAQHAAAVGSCECSSLTTQLPFNPPACRNKWCGRREGDGPFWFRHRKKKWKGKEKSSAARVSCALVYWQFPAVGRAEEEKEKSEGGERETLVIIWRHIWTLRTAEHACPAYILFHISRREKKSLQRIFFSCYIFLSNTRRTSAGQI